MLGVSLYEKGVGERFNLELNWALEWMTPPSVRYSASPVLHWSKNSHLQCTLESGDAWLLTPFRGFFVFCCVLFVFRGFLLYLNIIWSFHLCLQGCSSYCWFPALTSLGLICELGQFSSAITCSSVWGSVLDCSWLGRMLLGVTALGLNQWWMRVGT